VELAERRVLGLINPGLAPRLATTPSIFLGMQLILGGEFAPGHRHTPAAARLVVEGAGAFTTVNGEKLAMSEGDLILTPPHHWHTHHHEGGSPMIWMDILDHPVAIPLETSYSVEEAALERKPDLSNHPDRSNAIYTSAGLVPFRRPTQPPARYPLMRFQWTHTRAALARMADAVGRDVPVHLMFVNPESGASLLETLTFSVRLLRPAEEICEPKRSPSAIFYALEGEGQSEIDG